MVSGSDATVLLAWLTVYAVGAIGVTIAWTMAGSVFDARQARRLFPLCTGAAIAGSFVGTLSSGPVARAFGTETLVVLEAIMLAIVGGLVVAVSRTTTVRVPPRQRDRSIVADLRLGFDTVVRSPLMRLVAIAYVLLAILGFSVTYPFLLAASETFTTEADLATALGVLSAAVTATSFVVSVVARQPGLCEVRRHRRGPAAADRLPRRLRPVARGLLVLDRGALPVHPAGHPARRLQRGLERLLQRRPARASSPGAGLQRRRARPGRDDPLGIPPAGRGTLLALDQVFWLGVITALVCTIVVAGIRRRYRASVVDSLRTGLAEQVLEGGPGAPRSPATRPSATRSSPRSAAPEPGDPADGREPARPGHVPSGPVRRSIRVVDDDPDPGVRTAALEALATLGGPPSAVTAAMACLARRRRTGPCRGPSDPGGAGRSMPRRSIPTRGSRGLPTTRARPSVGHSRASTARTGRTRGRPGSSRLCWPDRAMRQRLVGLETDRRLGGAIPAEPGDPARRRPVSERSELPPWRRWRRATTWTAPRSTSSWFALSTTTSPTVRADCRPAHCRTANCTPLGLLDVLSSGSNRAQEAALTALRGHGPDVRQDGHRVDARPARTRHRAPPRAHDAGRLGDRPARRRRSRPSPSCWRSSLATRGAHDRARSSCPGRPRDTGGRAASSAAASTPTMPRSGRRRSRPSTPSATASSRGPSCGSSKTRRSMCGIAMPRLPGWPMMTTRGSAAWRGGYGQERTRCRTRVGPSAISRR